MNKHFANRFHFRSGIAVCWFLALTHLLATPCAVRALSTWNDNWWDENTDSAAWESAGSDLRSALLEHVRSGVRNPFDDSSNLRRWFYHYQWLGLQHSVPEELRPSYVAVGRSPELAEALLDALEPGDQPHRALSIYLRLYRDRPDAFPTYRSLAAAFAVVFDEPFPDDWPHHQVDSSKLPVNPAEEDPLPRFIFYVESNERRDLAYDISELGPEILKFVIDSRVELNELRWVRAETKFKLRKLDEAFSFITYDTLRIDKNEYNWPYSSYRLADIKSKNGICVDQAYFGTMVGKALGVPTLYFSGQGSGGGHAWFGFMERKYKWNTDVGRYESQNYPVGNARDPQTWQVINDAQLAFLSDGLHAHPNYRAARQALRLALLFSDEPEFSDLLNQARDLLPQLIEPWRVKANWLASQNQIVPLESHLREWIMQFDKQTDYKVEAQTLLLAVLKSREDPEAATLQKEIVRQNRRKRFDIGIAQGAEPILEKIEKGQWDAAEKEFKSMVRKFDDQGGGNLFYSLVRPYVQSCLEEQMIGYAKEGLDYAEKRMNPYRGSILFEEFASLRLSILETPAATTTGETP